MSDKKRLLIIVLVLVLLIAVAYALYERMSAGMETQHLSVTEVTTEAELAETTPAPDETEESTGSQIQQKPVAPDFTVYDIDGNAVKLSDYLGKPVVVNFWASWCGVCAMGMPNYEEAYKTYGDDVQFLMVNMTDGGRETVESASGYIAENGYTFPVLYDTDMDASYTYSVYSLPSTYFIDAEGYGVAQAIGGLDAETLQRAIEMIME